MTGKEQAENLPAVSVPLPWHDTDWQALLPLIATQRLPHALLLSGAAHTGKSAFALALARYLLCEAQTGTANCGECHPCQLSAAGSHGDLLWVEPHEKSKVVKIEQVRQAVTFTHGTASFGDNKVLVFAPANAMNVNAYNALLKSLEEPSAGTYLLLVCDSLQGIPATIRSRCHQLHLRSPDLEAATHWLAGCTGDEAIARQALALTDSRPVLAQSLYLENRLEDFGRQKLALRRLFTGEAPLLEISQTLSEQEPEAFVMLYLGELQRAVRTLTASQLVSEQGRKLFELLDTAQSMQRALQAGANPGRQLVLDLFLSKSHRVLGASQHGGKISPVHTGGSNV
ncbi:MAG: hypothetical protein NXI15_05375 [Gammaproteobacteria bacterium]|nr:hypothetical protein [Gammaproteobacteria bacterium]